MTASCRHTDRNASRPSSIGGKGVYTPRRRPFHPPGILLPFVYGAAHTCMVRAVLYCTVLRARKGKRARGAENFSRSARARTGEKVHKSSRILHALHVLKKTCKTGGCLLKISEVRRLVGPNPRSALWLMLYLVNIRAHPWIAQQLAVSPTKKATNAR